MLLVGVLIGYNAAGYSYGFVPFLRPLVSILRQLAQAVKAVAEGHANSVALTAEVSCFMGILEVEGKHSR